MDHQDPDPSNASSAAGAGAAARGDWPASVIVFGTFRCNQHCPMCGQEEVRSELTTQYPEAPEVVARLLEGIPATSSVHFSGGEILATPAFKEQAGILKRRGVPFTMTTNGMLLHRYPELAGPLAPDKIVVSLDSLDPGRYGRLRGVDPQILERVTANVEELRSRRRGGVPVIKANITVQPGNVGELAALTRRALAGAFDEVSVSHLQWVGSQDASFHMTSNAVRDGWAMAQDLDLAELERQLDQLEGLAEEHPPLRGERLRRYYRDEQFWLGGTCNWPRVGCYVMPDGRVFSCATFAMGSLQDATLPQVWSSAPYERFRERIDEALLPECRTCCHLQFELSARRPFLEESRS